MRPTGTSEKWRSIVNVERESIARAIDNLEMVEASHVREEAFTVSLILRQALDRPGTTASLITPDRELARRVKQELANCGIGIEDSAGEPLIRFGAAAFLGLLIDAVAGACAPEKFLALFKHELCRFGFEDDTARRAVNVIELSVFRASFIAPSLPGLADAVMVARQATEAEPHIHPAIKRITPTDWIAASGYARAAAACFSPLVEGAERSFGAHLETLLRCCEAAAGLAFWEGEEGETLTQVLEDLRSEAGTIPSCSFATAATLIQHYLTVTPFRTKSKGRSRLSILGLLEARLSRPDVAILGGLNEGRWPALPDAGPWLNRPMRATLGMQQPERDLGQTAHDFAQALGCKEVYLTWSRRIGEAPVSPSRWVLRLQMLIKAAKLAKCLGPFGDWQSLAARLEDPPVVMPCEPPRPMPPNEARPRRLSVTRVETLIRDPYAFYANQVLGLRPLEQISASPGMAERGMLLHRIIADFLKEFPRELPPRSVDYLLQRAQYHFAPLLPHPDVGTFWWPQFQRIANWLVANEFEQRGNIAQVYSEIEGRSEFTIANGPFLLTCRADRIDLLKDGRASIFDYKTGAVPTAKQMDAGLAPQLTLQSAMLESGAFAELGRRQTHAVYYVKLGSGSPPGELHCPKLKLPVLDCARNTMSGLISLLTAYEKREQPYLSRAMVEKEDEEREFDHLSRYREWALSGKAA
jgi:ATP-dependent helicase/nuclease subunit B